MDSHRASIVSLQGMLYPPNTRPAGMECCDAPVELGTKFRVSPAGCIDIVRLCLPVYRARKMSTSTITEEEPRPAQIEDEEKTFLLPEETDGPEPPLPPPPPKRTQLSRKFWISSGVNAMSTAAIVCANFPPCPSLRFPSKSHPSNRSQRQPG